MGRCCRGSLFGHSGKCPCRALLWDTLVGYPCRTPTSFAIQAPRNSSSDIELHQMSLAYNSLRLPRNPPPSTSASTKYRACQVSSKFCTTMQCCFVQQLRFITFPHYLTRIGHVIPRLPPSLPASHPPSHPSTQPPILRSHSPILPSFHPKTPSNLPTAIILLQKRRESRRQVHVEASTGPREASTGWEQCTTAHCTDHYHVLLRVCGVAWGASHRHADHSNVLNEIG